MQLTKKKIKIIAICISLLIISNINPIHEVVVMLTSGNYYRYSSERGDFTFMEEMKGRDTAMMKFKFNLYRQTSGDTIVYRLFSKNPLAFWRYSDYLKDSRYNLPYKNWGDIKAIRGEDQDLSRWQDF